LTGNLQLASARVARMVRTSFFLLKTALNHKFESTVPTDLDENIFFKNALNEHEI